MCKQKSKNESFVLMGGTAPQCQEKDGGMRTNVVLQSLLSSFLSFLLAQE
jgi:hypothetical protein